MERRTVSYAFEQLTGRFYSGVVEEYTDSVKLLDDMVEWTSQEHRIELRDFFATILSDGSTDLDLAAIWVSGYSDLYIRPDGARAFFQMFLDAFDRKLAAVEKENARQAQMIERRHAK